MKVSVLIPVYGVEKYLDIFLNSLHQQKLIECEFIIVNDASPDDCHSIILKYLKLDSRFNYINKKVNQGEMQARQDAFELAKGEYIINLDSDDYISSDFLEALYDFGKQNNLDMVLSKVVMVDEYGGKTKDSCKSLGANYIFDKNNIGKVLSLPYSSWSRLTKKTVMDSFDYKYLKGETELTKLQFIGGISSGYVECAVYYYRQRSNSLSSYSNASRKYLTSYGVEKIATVYSGDIEDSKVDFFSDEFKVFRFVNISKLVFLSHLNNGGISSYIREIKFLKSKYKVSFFRTFLLLNHLPIKTRVFSYLLYIGLSPILLMIKRL